MRIQRSSGVSGLLERWAGEGAILRRATAGARQVEEQLDALYARRREFVLATASRVVGTVAMAAELWAASGSRRAPSPCWRR